MGILCSSLGSCLSSLEPQQIFYASDEMMVMVMQAVMVIVGVVARAADRSVTAIPSLLPVCPISSLLVGLDTELPQVLYRYQLRYERLQK